MASKVSIDDVVTALRELDSNAARGLEFEKLMVRYFQLHPMYSQEYDEVLRWNDWKYKDPSAGDTGIDLVAHRAEDDSWTAIQCKFYEPTTTLQKSHLDSFYTASGRTFVTDTGERKSFSNRIIVSTTDRWGKNAEASLEGQTIPVQRIGLAEIADAPINWEIAYPDSDYAIEFSLTKRKRFRARKHQKEAIDAVFAGFRDYDRGKLIMACGTGKTFTALKLSERLATKLGGQAKILFCVPSISLLSQTLKEWTSHSEHDLRAYAVCSDKKVSKDAEDIATYELEVPVTTDGVELAAKMRHRRRAKGLTVVFTTYQSLQAIHEAQNTDNGTDPFDLIICDEAHRTTGITLAGEDASHFVRIHDNSYIRGTKRLYMTATPRLFGEDIKNKAEEHSAELCSMDDEDTYGPEFHRLSFGAAVEKGLLTDYKVLVLGINDQIAADTLPQALEMAGAAGNLDDVSKMIGAWNGLAKRSSTTLDTGKDQATGFPEGAAPMRRAVLFASDIASSRKFTDLFPSVTSVYSRNLEEKAATNEAISTQNLDLTVDAKHVDGTMNALQRGNILRWLKSDAVPEDECRIVTNARCLSEGVDVPALDAVIFMNPRNSQVDVVQSVGRVMRKSEGKTYGYIILPISIPADKKPSEVLNDNQKFKVVWQILNALRAHDERFNATVNSAKLNASNAALNTTIQPAFIDVPPKDTPAPADPFVSNPDVTTQAPEPGSTSHESTRDPSFSSQQLALFSMEKWQEAVYARIVDKVGTRTYWEDWAKDVANIADAQILRINRLLDTADPTVATEFDEFLKGLRANLNESISRDDAVSMLSQHLITAPVFDALFAEHDFAQHNPVSRVMQRMVEALSDKRLESETESLERFYRSVQVRASEVTTAEGKQQVIKDLYERFFKLAFKKQSEALGIVYTPVEIVDFINRFADWASRKHFGRGLTDEGVHILDPFTGTGTFPVRLLQSGLIRKEDLARKYATEIHATEIMLLAYYVAAVNIETTYAALNADEDGNTGGYQPFEGIALADTFQITEDDDAMDLGMFVENNDRIERQKSAPIHVIVGNPPYSVGQNNANDLNANVKYPTLDKRIEETYAARSTATNKNSLYDSYLRAFRWATDRIGDHGIVAFVSNGGWIDGNTADGIRLSFADEFSEMYVFNLRGNQRTAGEQSRKEGGKVFGSGSRNTVAIFIGIKTPNAESCTIHYRDIGDYLTREEKLTIIEHGSAESIEWQKITPNNHGDWVNQRSEEFETWPVLGDKTPGSPRIFNIYGAGLKTGRDAWCYSMSKTALMHNITRFLDTYESARRDFRIWDSSQLTENRSGKSVIEFLKHNPEYQNTTVISWNRSLNNQLAQGHEISLQEHSFRRSLYRPFTTQHCYFDRAVNDMVYRLPKMFPTAEHDNLGIYVVSPREAAEFTVISTDLIPDLSMFTYAGQFFPRWTWEPVETPAGTLDFGSATTSETESGTEGEVLDGYRRVDNITDEILAIYRNALGSDISKDDIFYFVYGQLHDPNYREAYAADLKKMLPHVETPSSRERFDQLTEAGRTLMDLHVNYEDVNPYPVDVQVKKSADPDNRETWRVTKMKWAKKKDPETGKNVNDTTTIIYSPKVTVSGIPEEAERYLLGSRSALGWIIDRYQVKKDKASGIVNDPNDWCDEVGNPRYIVDLIAKVTRVAVETVRITDSLR
ncbi:DEAD/DEAH box helicase [Corynebacterium sp. CCM 9203]|uniref:DEAD/DEAH box helicase n=1 Tax=Corynebacterium sp. CCM 9203 TaxID=3057615 RepID=UPI00352546CF